MKKRSWSNIVLAFFATIVLSACNYGALPDVSSPQPSAQSASTDAAPRATAEHMIFIPAIQSEGGTPVGADQGASPQTFDPHVEIQVNNATLKIGETLVLVARPVDIGMPIYSLLIRDEGVQDVPPAANVTYENKVQALENFSKVLEFVSAEAGPDQATFILRATAQGATTVSVEASGEVHNPNVEQATMNGGGMGNVLIKVTN